MTCKDCLHYEACCSWFNEKIIDETSNAMNNGEIEMCSAFKDKNRFVEVVRCKDCECFERDYDDSIIGDCSDKRQNLRCNENHFCGYGRK